MNTQKVLIVIAVFVFILLVTLIYQQFITQDFENKEIHSRGNLLDYKQALSEIGWSRSPIKDLQKKAYNTRQYQLKEIFNVIADGQLVLYVNIHGYNYFEYETLNNSSNEKIWNKEYEILVYAYLINENREFTAKDTVQFNPLERQFFLTHKTKDFEGDYALTSVDKSIKISARYENSDLQQFVYVDLRAVNDNNEVLTAQFSLVKGKRQEELASVTPLYSKFLWWITNYGYNYDITSFNLVPKGFIQLNNQKFDLQTNSLGGRQWQRYTTDQKRNTYNIKMIGQGFIDDKRFTLFVGRQCDSFKEFYLQNALFIDDQFIKIGNIQFTIPELEDEPIRFETTEDEEINQIQGQFQIISNIKDVDDSNHFAGLFSGQFIDEQGKSIKFSNIYGYAYFDE